MSGNPDPAGELSIGCRCGYPVVDATTEKERQASTLAVLVLVGALESGRW